MRTIEIIMRYVSGLLGLDEMIEFVIVDGKNQERTRAICDRENYRIYFNEQWINNASEIEILECILHECRHCYQQACIDYPDIFNKEDISVVDKWKKEFDAPINPYDDEIGYSNQTSEIDANRYALEILTKLKNELIK